jgi:hypothetical protein
MLEPLFCYKYLIERRFYRKTASLFGARLQVAPPRLVQAQVDSEVGLDSGRQELGELSVERIDRQMREI